tara:strand:- start:11031 stop:11222 length:192 start_codon:yes stop_codon:yes gene_type:complete
MTKYTMADPPSGWKYGFPKRLPADRMGDTNKWLVEEGYPEWEIDNLGEYFYVRYWEQEVLDGK